MTSRGCTELKVNYKATMIPCYVEELLPLFSAETLQREDLVLTGEHIKLAAGKRLFFVLLT